MEPYRWDLRRRPPLLRKASVRDALEAALEVVRDHHDAWAVSVFGEAAGVTQQRVSELASRGLIDPPLAVPGMRHQIDPWQMAIMMGSRTASASAEELEAMRAWPLERWGREIDRLIDERLAEPQEPIPTSPPASPHHPELLAPPPPPRPPGGGGGPMIPAPPPHLTDVEREAWIQARTRGAEYARGLGNIVDADMRDAVIEAWDGDLVTHEADREQRLIVREQIRTETAAAIAEGQGPAKLASRLGNLTGDWSRDWDRIAKTELQGAYNDAVVITAVRQFGPDVGIARVPEAAACGDCRRVFLVDGKPRIWGVEELLDNGTNVGLKREEWKATLWPVHPRCRCSTMVVPQGMRFDMEWRLR